MVGNRGRSFYLTLLLYSYSSFLLLPLSKTREYAGWIFGLMQYSHLYAAENKLHRKYRVHKHYYILKFMLTNYVALDK